MEKLDFLIDYLIKENKNIYIKEMPRDLEGKNRLYRSLCNIREPMPIAKEYTKIENEFLQEENIRKGINDSNEIESFIKYKGTEICLWQGDITTLKIDTIVNAANSQGLGCFIPCHKCIDNNVHSMSGIELRRECNEIMQEVGVLKTGKAFITKGYNLPAKYVIHTVGPIIYKNVTEKEIIELKNCYINSLEIAKENNLKTIAFPCISTGEFKFPKELASRIAVETIKEYLKTSEKYFEKIVFDVFEDNDYNSYLKYLGEEYEK